MEHFRRRTSAQGGLPYLGRALSGLTIQRAGASNDSTEINEWPDPPEDIKGLLGLNLLHDPLEPLVDFIFVHGLGGGSRKTWAKTNNPAHYWPKEWLPQDPDFKHVRVYSFGYKADWGEKKDSSLDIHDFAHSLLGEIQDNPKIKRSNTRIVLVGHSMGGIVIKEAYILARQDSAFNELAARIHTIYFLATPHRGSDLTKTLTNILKVTYGQKPYVTELERNSSSVCAINDSFRHFAEDLHLWSFYETLPSNLMFLNVMVVDKSSATLGYAQERIALLNADHRGVCKFERLSDPNYKTLRNAFSTTVDAITAEVSQFNRKASHQDLRRLRSLTGVSHRPEEDLMALDDARLAGSCEWLTSKNVFKEWTIAWSSAPPIFWLSGNPASGKSVLCSHVIANLEAQGLNCSYFFFKHTTTDKSSVSDCLRSLAYQMACRNEDIRKRLLEYEGDLVTLDNSDERAVWRKLFMSGVFQVLSSQSHYWVIDALDECNRNQPLFSLISKIPASVRIFITSRRTQDIEQGFTGLIKSTTHEQIHISDTADDIKRFITSRMDRLPVGDSESSGILEERLLRKSAGSFLWVRLVVQELEHTFSEEAIEDVLNEVPADMNLLYTRTLEGIANMSRGTRLAKAILTWTACASRPLRLNEMQCALKLDINETVHNLERSIASVCGQLVFVDQSSRIQMIHQTARDFLLQQGLNSIFAVSKAESHTHLALICLRFIAGDYFKITRFQKQKPTVKPGASVDSAFANYACTFFSDHILKSLPAEQSLIDALCEFLGSNVLSWVEHISRTGDLYHITRTATNLKAYIGQRATYSFLVSKQVEIIKAWIVDLIRVSAKFRTNLLTSPSSIYWLIPPLCPSESIIARTCRSRQGGLLAVGMSAETWDDCLARIDYRGFQATAIAHGDGLFAVGLSDGKVSVHHSISMQTKRFLDHGERVKILEFGVEDRYLASSGLRMIRVWDPGTGNQIWSSDTPNQVLALVFTGEDDILMATTQGNFMISWALPDGAEIGRLRWNEDSKDGSLEERPCQPPSRALLSLDCNTLAVSYRGRSILLFDVANETLLGTCFRDATSPVLGPFSDYLVDAMAFNPSPEMNILIASYGDGELTVYNSWSAELRHRVPGVYAHCLACSNNGRSLVTGSSHGTLQLFEFGGPAGESLTLIYRIEAQEEGIRALAFSKNSLRFTDIRRSQCRVWEPAVLVRKNSYDGSEGEFSQSPTVTSKRGGLIGGRDEAEITALCCHPDGKVIFCGKQDGSVSVYHTLDGRDSGIIYRHALNIAITDIALGMKESIIVSGDESSGISIKKIVNNRGQWSASETLASRRFTEPIHGLLISPFNDRLLINGKESSELWSLQGQKLDSKTFKDQRSRVVVCHPLHPELFIVIEYTMARIFKWADFQEISDLRGIKLNRFSEPIPESAAALAFVQGQHILTELRKPFGDRAPTSLECWQASSFEANSASLIALPGFEMLGPSIEMIIAVVGTILLFLDTDFWVCSLELNTFEATPMAKRHFFIPSEWQSRRGNHFLQYTSRREFVFAKRGELVVIKRGLDFSETLSLSRAQQKWTFSQGSMRRRTAHVLGYP